MKKGNCLPNTRCQRQGCGRYDYCRFNNKDERSQEKKYATLVKLGTSLASYRLGYYDSTNPVDNVEELRDLWQQNQAVSAPHKTKI